MTDISKPQYDVEPPEDEESAAKDPADIHALDVCPKCGASLPDISTLVCLRCGYDLKSMSVIKTKVGVETAPGEQVVEGREPLVAPGRGDSWLPMALAAGGILLLTIGYLAAVGGLFATEGEIGPLRRLEGLARSLVHTGVTTTAALGAIVGLARLNAAPLGNLRLAAARMLGIVAVIGVIRFLNFQSDTLEWALESVLQAAAFVALSMLLFRLEVREALTLLGLLVLALIVLLGLAAIVLWAMAWEAVPPPPVAVAITA